MLLRACYYELAESNIEKKASIVDIIAPMPRAIDANVVQRRHFFPVLPPDCFQKYLIGKKLGVFVVNNIFYVINLFPINRYFLICFIFDTLSLIISMNEMIN